MCVCVCVCVKTQKLNSTFYFIVLSMTYSIFLGIVILLYGLLEENNKYKYNINSERVKR
jgi:hypothetical protein